MDFFAISTLSQAGRAEMLKSVVLPQLFHWLQVMKFPGVVSKQIDQLMRNFLWKGKTDKSATIQVKWNLVCQSKKNGGLGLLSIKPWNDAALIKMMDDILRGKNSIWAVWAAETKLRGESFWEIEEKNVDSSFWKHLLALRSKVFSHYIYKLKDGSRVKFFHDPWLTGHRLAVELDQHCRYLLGPELLRVGAFIHRNNWVLPSPPARQYTKIWKDIGCTPIHGDLPADIISWKPSSSGAYTVKQGYGVLHNHAPAASWASVVWPKAAVPRLSTCAWKLLHGQLATADTLKERGWRLASRCYFCLQQEETQDHWFVCCKLATWLWTIIYLKLGRHWRKANSVQQLV